MPSDHHDSSAPDSQDVWSEWLLHHRHADDPAYAQVVRAKVEAYADRVLDGARLAPGMTLADIGAGEGLVAFRAIDRVGPSLRVLLTDISPPMLRHAETLAVERGVRPQCAFFHCSAESLAGIADASVDAVASRSVLAYVPDKKAALAEFLRILKPGGRLSLAEPVLRDEANVARALRDMVDSETPEARETSFMPLMHRWKAAQYPDTEEAIAQAPITSYTERDLFRFAMETGFAEIHLELHIDLLPVTNASWEVFIGSSPHPLAPPLKAILAQRFTPEERRIFEKVLRPTVEAGKSPTIDRMAYLTAVKPGA